MNLSTFSALAEPHRLDIVELLREKPYPVNELVTTLKLNQPQVSKHLKVLSDAGIVEVKPLAQKRYYQLRPQPLQEIDQWIKQYRKLWEQSFNKLEILLKEEQKNKKKKK